MKFVLVQARQTKVELSSKLSIFNTFAPQKNSGPGQKKGTNSGSIQTVLCVRSMLGYFSNPKKEIFRGWQNI